MTTTNQLHMQNKQALSRREEVVLVAGTVDVALVNLLGTGKSEAVLSSGGLRASRRGPVYYRGQELHLKKDR